jgi:hypothetical protein
MPNTSVYAASKAGVLNLRKTLSPICSHVAWRGERNHAGTGGPTTDF